MKIFIVKILILLMMPMTVFAEIPRWKIIPTDSTLSFTGTANDSSITGVFKKFDGDIFFDPNHLNESRVRLVVDINSVSTSYQAFTDTLLSNDWFHIKLFPKAFFSANKFKKINEYSYEALGKLTIRDKTLPLTLFFKAQILSDTRVVVTGQAILKRLSFGVGQGDWGSLDEVKNEVTVDFKITANKASVKDL